ncbi:hypothetical protein OHA25_61105 (plasmid) [Nonomuraea sp. NBC_00507]
MTRRLTVGRLAVCVEPRDLWVGVYIAPDSVYMLLFPMLVFRWRRRPR